MKTVIAGCGNIGAVHAACVVGMEAGCLTGFADIREDRAREFAAKYGGRAYQNLEDMMETEKPDVLHICTPHFLHVPMALYGLSHGVHVFMEKPPVISQEQLAELMQGTAAFDRRLGFCFQNRYNAGVKEVRALLNSGKAGKVLGARGIVTWSRDENYYSQSGWRGKIATEGGGALINQAIHTMDLLVSFMGKPISVEAGAQNHHLKGVIEVEDTLEAYIRFEQGTACFYATTAYMTDAPTLIELVCEKMTIRLEEPEVTLFYPDGRKERWQAEKKEVLGKSYWGAGHRDCIEDFYRCIRLGERFPQDLEGIYDTAVLMLGTYESAKSGSVVNLLRKSRQASV